MDTSPLKEEPSKFPRDGKGGVQKAKVGRTIRKEEDPSAERRDVGMKKTLGLVGIHLVNCGNAREEERHFYYLLGFLGKREAKSVRLGRRLNHSQNKVLGTSRKRDRARTEEGLDLRPLGPITSK